MVKIFKKMMVLLDARQKRIMVLQLILMLIGAILKLPVFRWLVPGNAGGSGRKCGGKAPLSPR